MLHTTMTDDLIAEISTDMSFEQMLELAGKYANLILESDSAFYGIERRLVGYGTWQAKINFANEYYFGEGIAHLLTHVSSIITHDEDKEFTLEDFSEDIEEELVDFISDTIDDMED